MVDFRCELSNQVPYFSSRPKQVRKVSGSSSLLNTSNLDDVMDCKRARSSGVVFEQITELKIEPELDPDTILGSRSSSKSVEKTPIPSIPKQLPPLMTLQAPLTLRNVLLDEKLGTNKRVSIKIDVIHVGHVSRPAGTHTVDSSTKGGELHTKRLGQVDTSSLGSVVWHLVVRNVDNHSGHRGGDDQRALSILLEHLSDVLGAVVNTVEVDVHDSVPVLVVVVDVVEDGSGFPNNTGVGDKHVDGAEVLNDLVNGILDVLRGGNVDPVSLCLDTVLLGELLCGFCGIGVVPDDKNITAGLTVGLSSSVSNSVFSGSSSNNTNLALHREKVKNTFTLKVGWRRLWQRSGVCSTVDQRGDNFVLCHCNYNQYHKFLRNTPNSEIQTINVYQIDLVNNWSIFSSKDSNFLSLAKLDACNCSTTDSRFVTRVCSFSIEVFRPPAARPAAEPAEPAEAAEAGTLFGSSVTADFGTSFSSTGVSLSATVLTDSSGFGVSCCSFFSGADTTFGSSLAGVVSFLASTSRGTCCQSSSSSPSTSWVSSSDRSCTLFSKEVTSFWFFRSSMVPVLDEKSTALAFGSSLTSGFGSSFGASFGSFFGSFFGSSFLGCSVCSSTFLSVSSTNVGRWIKERHQNTRRGVHGVESSNWAVFDLIRVPDSQLSFGVSIKTSGGQSICVSEPANSGNLGSGMAWSLRDDFSGLDVPNSELLVSRSSDNFGSVKVPGKTCHEVLVLQCLFAFQCVQVPDLDGVVERGRSKNVFGHRVVQNVSDFTGMTSQSGHWRNIDNFVGINLGESVVFRNFPK
ncbi:hypothetical protein OGAPHI_001901 [Ogataea philodendri]|uniref:Uncharacterized protein n=1 Tax=Ogataea philodendri TaxID=1378263 RepID=A0A9P8P9Z5_9ASCO|nr:uncharacterized protein OGAPHI_001901 [Ogataea philodendri]KAH3668147.1 hypothetical protein OGAPHI_001901 [Ogataea philodendri]